MLKKLFCFIILIFTFCSIVMISGCGKSSSNENNSNYSVEDKASNDNEQTKDKSQAENVTDSEKNSSNKNSNNNITSDGGPVWNKDEHNAAEKFANELVTLIKNKDIDSISKKVSYPIKIKIDGKNTKISNKEKFVSIGFDKIFSKELIQEINKTSRLFSNQYGFSLGEAGQIWFSPMGKTNEIKITAINN